MQNLGIMQIKGDSLTELLRMYQVNVRKTSTKAAKIRELMKIPSVIQACPEAHLLKIESRLAEMEARRNKKHEAANDEQEDENVEEETWHAGNYLKVKD